jgi:hypothetical protein
MNRADKLGEKNKACHDDIFFGLHFEDQASSQKILSSPSSITVPVKLEG